MKDRKMPERFAFDLDLKTALSARRHAFELCLASTEVIAASQGKGFANSLRFTCPCCGYPTLAYPALYEICFLCGWEDDGQEDIDADEILGGPNHEYSLTAARSHFVAYRQMYDPSDTVRFNRLAKAQTLRDAAIALFDELLPSVNPLAFLSMLPTLFSLCAKNDRR